MSLEKKGLIPRFEGHQKDCLAEITLATLRLVQNNPKRFSWLVHFFLCGGVLLRMYHFKTGEAKPYGTFCSYYSVSYPSISRNVLTERVSVQRRLALLLCMQVPLSHIRCLPMQVKAPTINIKGSHFTSEFTRVCIPVSSADTVHVG